MAGVTAIFIAFLESFIHMEYKSCVQTAVWPRARMACALSEALVLCGKEGGN